MPLPKFSIRWLFNLVMSTAIVAFLGNAFFRSLQYARREALRLSSQSPLNQLQLALHNYHYTFGTLPPAYVVDESGKPIHSWRVLILPYVEQKALYDQYDFGEPWNGPNNIMLLNQMPDIFRVASERPSSCFTNVLAFTGRQTAFPGSRALSFADLQDGTENTALLGEIANSKIVWLEPRDFDLDTGPLQVQQPRTANSQSTAQLQLSSVEWRRPHIVFADSIHAYAVSSDMPTSKLQALFTAAGRESVTRQQLVEESLLK
jgi:Protein of unknown function (DUF1559)